MRILLICAAVAMLVSAFCLYAINYDTRQFEEGVQAQERKLEKTREDIAILKADRAFAGRPSVIGPAARELGLAPASEAQFVRDDTVVGVEGDSVAGLAKQASKGAGLSQ